MRNLYVDMGANWANTLHLGAERFPGRGPWLTVGFEASPLIQPYVEQYVQYLNGERRAAPETCLPRSGSTVHLRRYAEALNCTMKSDVAMRECAWAKLGVHLARLRADPALNSTALVARRLKLASHISSAPCTGTCRSRAVAVPAAVGARNGWARLWGAPEQLIRGGAKPAAPAGAGAGHFYVVPQVDVAAWLLALARRIRARQGLVFVKIDVEGAEHAILHRMQALGAHRTLDALAVECHEPGCAATMQRVRAWGVPVLTEATYGGMDSKSEAEQTLPRRCLANHSTRSPLRSVQAASWVALNISGDSKRKERRCALLSTAGALLHHERGAEVDAHDLVIRTGQAPVRGFERYVGRRTHYRIMSGALYEANRKMNISRLRRELSTETLLYTKLRRSECGKVERWHRQHKIKSPYICLGVGRPECNFATRWNRHLSSGFESVFIALNTLKCTEITLYGFNTTENLEASYHYWTDGSYHDRASARKWYDARSKTRDGHDFRAEQRALALASHNSVLTRQSLAALCNRSGE